jgi:tetratricopeptide (TPR) repeat protein
VLTAEELHQRGVAAINAGRVRVARPLLERAHALAVDLDLLARIEASLAFIAADTGAPEEALAICDRALTRTPLKESTRGVVHSQRAHLLMMLGRTAEALDAFGSAIGSLDDLPADLGKAHLNRGGVYLQQGLAALAEADFLEAALELELTELPVEAAMAKHNLGYCRLLSGDLVSALSEMDAARAVLAPLSPVHEATCDQDRAEVLIAAGLTSEGRVALRNASRAYGSRGLQRRRAEAELVLARTLQFVDPQTALAIARQASRRFQRSGADAWRTRADGVALAAEVNLGRKGPAMLERGQHLIDELTAQGLDWGAASIRLHTARVMIRRGDFEGARTRLSQVRVTEAAPLSLRLLVRDVRSELAATQRRPTAALMQIRQGLEELHAWQSTFGSLDLQTGVVGQGRRLAVHGLGLAVEVCRPEVLYEWSERARMLASRITPVRPPADDAMASDLAELRRLNASPDVSLVPAPRRDAELRRRVRERAWQNPGSGEVTEPAPLGAIRYALGTDIALVAWVISRGRLDALVVTDEGESIHHLGAFAKVREMLVGLLPDLDMAASTLPPALTRVVREGLAERLDQLGDALVTPLLERLGDRRVVATPSGGLAGTPWSLLPGLVGRPVTVAQSATSWLLHRQQPIRVSTAGFVAGPRVERAAAEVAAASLVWPGAETLVDSKASADGVAALAGEVDVLHVAAHGRHSADNPLFSGLELADGPWFGYDIDLLTNVPQVVILSACEVGRSSVRFGEELIGMTAAWLHAGARCVIASPSAVADEAAHDVLTAMHEHLARGLDPAAALAAAVPPASGGAPPAPFVCFGTGW